MHCAIDPIVVIYVVRPQSTPYIGVGNRDFKFDATLQVRAVSSTLKPCHLSNVLLHLGFSHVNGIDGPVSSVVNGMLRSCLSIGVF